VQIDAPREIYERPANIYAAQRLGSPPINLLPPELLGINDLPEGTQTLGVRPEDVVLGASGLPGKVLTVEHLGVESIALVDIGGQSVHALLGARTRTQEGETVSVSVQRAAVMCFDASGQRIAGGAAQDKTTVDAEQPRQLTPEQST